MTQEVVAVEAVRIDTVAAVLRTSWVAKADRCALEKQHPEDLDQDT